MKVLITTNSIFEHKYVVEANTLEDAIEAFTKYGLNDDVILNEAEINAEWKQEIISSARPVTNLELKDECDSSSAEFRENVENIFWDATNI